jgi:two-component system sensor histidine kinase ChvG
LATVIAKPEPDSQGAVGSPGETGPRRRFAWPRGSRLGRLIITLNVLALAIVIVGALVLNELRSGLVNARIDSLTTQGQLIAKVINELATSQGDTEPTLDAAAASQILQVLFIQHSQRARLFDAQGKVLADSFVVADRVDWKVLPPARKPGQNNDGGRLAPREAAKAEKARAALVDEVAQAVRSGRAVTGMRVSEDGERVVSVSIPIQRVQAVLGVLTLEAGGVDEIISAERKALLPFIVVAMIAIVISSVLLHRLIAVPVLRLARAADHVRLQGARAISLPDLSERRDEVGDLSRSLEDMTHSLSERMDAIERFAADVAHEIKNPLTSIRSAIETLDLVSDPAARARLLAILQNDVNRLDRLVTDISNASRLDAELSREHPKVVDLSRLLTEIAGLYEAQLRPGEAPGSVRVGLRIADPSPPSTILGRETPIGQVFRNLVDNARSFSPADGEVRIQLARTRGHLLVMVEDDGPGIPPDNLETIFERFYTSRPKGRAFGGNSGLGLSIARQIVEAHGGTIRAENRMDIAGGIAGARFVVELPSVHE